MLGDRLFPLVLNSHPIMQMQRQMCLDSLGKIIDLLLGIDNTELLHMLEDQDSLKGKVEEAVAVLRAHQGSSGVKECATRVSISCQAALGEDEKRASGVSVSCQTALEEQKIWQSSETAAEEATYKVASDEASKRAAQIEAVAKRWGSALEANLWKAPQTKKFLEEVLPRVSVPCQAGSESGGAYRPWVLPHQGGQPEVMTGQARYLPGSSSSRPPDALVCPLQ